MGGLVFVIHRLENGDIGSIGFLGFLELFVYPINCLEFVNFELKSSQVVGITRDGPDWYCDNCLRFHPSGFVGFGGSVDLAAILDFVDSGHDLILAADSNASELIREIATECGVDFDEVCGHLEIFYIWRIKILLEFFKNKNYYFFHFHEKTDCVLFNSAAFLYFLYLYEKYYVKGSSCCCHWPHQLCGIRDWGRSHIDCQWQFDQVQRNCGKPENWGK